MIYTFYSYKGGVGRSMALANVAESYYRQGLKVVMIDWDLEAPGLENFFFTDSEKLDSVRAQPGLIDMLLAYKQLYSSLPMPMAGRRTDAGTGSAQDPVAVLEDNLAPITALLRQVHHGDGGTETGRLWLLPAGWRSEERFARYAQEVKRFDWSELYRSYHGEAYFEWLRRQLHEVADVVLIDSRTGVTEMGGVCARQLADAVVSFCAPNDQNLAGVRDMVDSFRRPEVLRARQRALDVVVVPARLDNSETTLRNAFEKEFKATWKDTPKVFAQLERSYWDLRIPYIPQYAYKEQLAVGAPDRHEDLENAYLELASHLALLAPETSALRRRLPSDFLSRFPIFPTVFVTYSKADGEPLAKKLGERLRESGVSIWEDAGGAEQMKESAVLEILRHSRHMIVAVTPAAASSEELRRHWLQARQLGVRLHFVVGDPETSAATLADWMLSERILDLEGDWESLLRRLAARLPTLRVPFMAPPLPPRFVGRSGELKDLKRLLLLEDSPSHVALVGPGGCGKTALAIAACHDDRVIEHFEGGIFWITLGRRPDLLAGFLAVHRDLTDAPSSFASTEAAVAEVAATLEGRRSLLVLDDVEDAGEIPRLFDSWTGLRLLITARDRTAATVAGARLFPVPAMSPSEALELLGAGHSLARDEQLALEALAERLGGLPLALKLAREQLRELLGSSSSFGTAIETLDEALSEQGAAALDPSSREAPRRSLTLALAETLDELPRRDREHLTELVRTRASSLLRASEALGLGHDEARELLRRLADRSVITNLTGDGFSIHPLVRGHLERRAKLPEPTGDSLVARARAILQGERAELGGLVELAKALKNQKRFTYARRLLARAWRHDAFEQSSKLGRTILQQLALCTYKDDDLPADQRHDRALEILTKVDDLKTTRDQETLGLAGAVNKRKWELDGQRSHLERALGYYLRGYQAGDPSSPDYDYGYTGINASYVLDLLASEEDSEDAKSSRSAIGRRAEAQEIRESLVATLPPLMADPDRERESLGTSWWFLVTLGEACFGLGRYEEARGWLLQAAALPEVPDWELETTSRHLAGLARLRSDAMTGAESEAWEVLRSFLGGDVHAVRMAMDGKVGLALSGGGFRASLFHIGVLARLAELDMLRGVEVLSCVSGGSIIGAHYYLEVRELLQKKADEDITREDYVEIVARLERDFLAGVQTNIRTRVAASLIANLKMIFSPRFSRTELVGDLFESKIFARVDDGGGDGEGRRWLNELFIRPKDEPEGFAPKLHNWHRRAKVPILVINATTLNTGHNWQFTASWMGEPPGRIDTGIDGNDRLRRLYYSEAPEPHRRVRLGHAVAASSCVPGLFEPLALPGLYPDRTVRLADGGVYDNQGIGALLEQDCTVLLVSDASGQMSSIDDPSTHPLSVLLRANNTLQSRVRSVQQQELVARRRSGLLRGLTFLHLKKDLDVDPVDWIDSPDPFEASDDVGPPEDRGPLTSYGIRKDFQALLAGVRTDLDSFSDAEAYALMVSGYRMTSSELRRSVEAPAERLSWRFQEVEELLRRTQESRETRKLKRLLETGGHSTFKLWHLSRKLRIAILAALGLVLAFVVFLVGWRSDYVSTVLDGIATPKGLLGGLIALILLAPLVQTVLSLSARIFNRLARPVLGILWFFLALIPANVSLLFNKAYLRAGRLQPASEDK